MLLVEIKQTMQNAIFYLNSLKSEINMLSLQHLTTDTIAPKDLKLLLLDIEGKLANNFELPRNPHIDIWYFIRRLPVLLICKMIK